SSPAADTLFASAARRHAKETGAVPLAERMRPTRAEDYVGQSHILAPGKLLANAIAQDRVPSMVLWGPPGVGKTTLGRVIAARTARGDARRALAMLEAAAEYAKTTGAPAVTTEILAASEEKAPLLYDKAGEEHYNVVSAFIKSMRGSDPDAAVYWMMRMLEAGEDPLFVARRMVIFAAEDVGNAEPQALQVAVAAKDAVHFVGLPE